MERMRTCYECMFSQQVDGGTWCLMFSEQIHSEIFAAKDCEEYTIRV